MSLGTIKIEGVDDLIQRVNALVPKSRTAVKRALRKASRPIVASAKARAPRSTGSLAAAQDAIAREGKTLYEVIGAKRGKKSAARKRAEASGRRLEPANYAHLQERGVRPHSLGKVRTEVLMTVLAGKKRRKRIVARWNDAGAHHPGHPAQPFLGPAFEARKAEVLPALKSELLKVLESAG